MMQCNRWKVLLTLAAHQRGVLRVGEAQIQGQLALGSVDQLGVGEADLQAEAVLGLVVQPVVRVEAPGPGGRVLDRVGRQLALQRHLDWGREAQLDAAKDKEDNLLNARKRGI